MPPGGSRPAPKWSRLPRNFTHRKLTEPRFGELLKIVQSGKLSAGEAANVREWRREYDRGVKLPDEFVVRAARLYSESFDVWQKAKRESNYALFAPTWRKLLIPAAKKPASSAGRKIHMMPCWTNTKRA